MSRASYGRPTVVAIAHFAPPVHGMAVVVGRFCELLERHADVLRHSIAAATLSRGPRYHASRTIRVLRALMLLARVRRRSRVVYMSCDGGFGLVYTVMMIATARLLGYAIYLHHNSYAYLSEPRRLMRLVVAIGGNRCSHIVLCERMREDFRKHYPRAQAFRIVSPAFAIEGPPSTGVARAISPRLRLGHFGNLTEEKGLATVFRVLAAARHDGIDLELLLGGPAVGPRDQSILRDGLDRAGGFARWLGPLFGSDRERFFSEIDLFLFPSRYANESYGLVVWEAMLRGIPVAVYRAGCLHRDAVGPGGLVIEPAADFANEIIPFLRRLTVASFGAAASSAARSRALQTVVASETAADTLAQDLAAHAAVGTPGEQ